MLCFYRNNLGAPSTGRLMTTDEKKGGIGRAECFIKELLRKSYLNQTTKENVFPIVPVFASVISTVLSLGDTPGLCLQMYGTHFSNTSNTGRFLVLITFAFVIAASFCKATRLKKERKKPSFEFSSSS